MHVFISTLIKRLSRFEVPNKSAAPLTPPQPPRCHLKLLVLVLLESPVLAGFQSCFERVPEVSSQFPSCFERKLETKVEHWTVILLRQKLIRIANESAILPYMTILQTSCHCSDAIALQLVLLYLPVSLSRLSCCRPEGYSLINPSRQPKSS